MKRILVIDGNEADIVRPADQEPKLPDGVALADYDGAVITGSALNIHSRSAAITDTCIKLAELRNWLERQVLA
jgi:hypothetical protein